MNELTLEAKRENLDSVLDFVHQALDESQCSPKSLMQLDLAVEELFVNIAQYAYYPKTGAVTILAEFYAESSEITVTLIDKGIPYNPLSKKDPDMTLAVKERPIGGLGIYMAKNIMDRLSYEYKDGQNILRISKKVKTDAVQAYS